LAIALKKSAHGSILTLEIVSRENTPTAHLFTLSLFRGGGREQKSGVALFACHTVML
jgi:hypothetical protein